MGGGEGRGKEQRGTEMTWSLPFGAPESRSWILRLEGFLNLGVEETSKGHGLRCLARAGGHCLLQLVLALPVSFCCFLGLALKYK